MATYLHPLLNDDDLVELTGYIQTRAQIRWLSEHAIPHTLRRDGRPRTTWGAIETALAGEARAISGEPNLDWL